MDPSPKPLRLRASAIAGAVAIALLAGVARAGDPVAAEALFREAKRLAGEKNFAEACPKFEASYRLDKTFGTLLNMADCHESLGKIATAWAEFGEAAEWAKRDGDKRETYARDRQDKLADRLPKLQITVAHPVAGLDVYRDEEKLDSALFGTPVPVDPGSHAVTVRRGDKALNEQKVDAAEKATATVNVDLEQIDKENPAPVPTATPSASGTSGGPPLPPPRASNQKTVGLVVAGVGAAAVVTAAVLEVLAITNKSAANDVGGCVEGFCTPTGIDQVHKAQTFAEAGQWVGIGGLVFVAVGATLLLTAPPAAEQRHAGTPPRRAWAAPWVAPGAGGVAVGGRM